MRSHYRRVVHRIGILLLALGGVACGAVGPSDTPQQLRIAASIPPHAWLVERIGGDAVEAVAVLGPGESPATLQPSDVQVSRVLSSRVFFSAGVPFEAGSWLDALAGHLEIVALHEGAADRVMGDHSHSADGPDAHGHPPAADPHAWLSPSRFAEQGRVVAETLIRVDPDHTDVYAVNLRELAKELEELDRWIRTTLAPHHGRAFVVFHPSWGYFADDYGLRQLAIEIDGKEPSDHEITRLRQETAALDITVVFVQPQIAGRSAHAVAGALGADIATLDPLAADVPVNLRLATDAIASSFHD